MSNVRVPKLVLCDVDGTLIDSSEKITPEFDELKRLLQENEIRFSLASGRSLELLTMYIDQLEIKAPVIINNGAGARIGTTVLWDELFPAAYVKDVIKMADLRNDAIFMCFGDYERVYRHNNYVQREIDVFQRYNRFYIPLEHEWEKLEFERVMITDPEKPGSIQSLLPKLEPYKEYLEVIQYDDRHIDIMKKGVSKGLALERLAQSLKIRKEEIMVIGDGVNDIELFQAAGIGIAVGNAKEQLKQVADYVCREKNTKGVIEAIRHQWNL